MTGPGKLGPVRALICEDEPLAVRALREYLADVEWIEVVDEARDGRTAMRLIHKHEPDLVFLDVRMPRLTGVEVLEAVTHHPAVVFTTAFDEYAVSAFELGAVDYLVKPFGKRRLLETLDRVRVRLLGEGMVGEGDGPREGRRRGPPAEGDGPRRSGRIFARRGDAVVPVRAADIVRCEAETGSVRIATVDGETLRLAATLTEVEARLDPGEFVRVHRSHLVNLAHVTSIRPYDDRRLAVRLSDGGTVVASRRGSQALREMMG